MAVKFERKQVLLAIALLLGALLAWGWVDGGERPIAPVSEPIKLPAIQQ